jgi:hypothetical protein
VHAKVRSDMNVRALFSFVVFGSLLIGCGGGSPKQTAPAVNPLTGNWLLIGSLSNFGPLSVPGQGQVPFNLAVSLYVTGGMVTGDASTAFFCTNSGGGGGGGFAPAAIAADGSFELQPLTLAGVEPTATFDVRAVAPRTAGETWSGTYTATDTNKGCTPTSGSFTAVPIEPVTGTYAAAGTLSQQGSSSSTPVKITAMFEQGAPTGTVFTSTRINIENVLSGSIVVEGSPCFTSGTMKPMGAEVIGGALQANYAMNDGSTIFVSGYIQDTAVSTIKISTFLVNGGSCDGDFGFFNTSLVRQSGTAGS